MSSARPVPAQPLVIRIRFWAELARLLIIGMEVMLISGWYSGLNAGQITWAGTALVLGVVILGSHYLARLLNLLHITERRRQVLFGIWILLAVFGSMKLLIFPGQAVNLFHLVTYPFNLFGFGENASTGGFIHLVLVGLLIWRGVALAAQPVSVGQAQRSFQGGIIILLLYGFALGRDTQSGYGLAFAFLLLGVLAMAFARISAVSDLRGGHAGKFSRDWIAGISGTALLMVAIGVGSGALLGAPLEWGLKAILGLVMGALAILMVVLAYPITWLMSWLVPLLARLLTEKPTIQLLDDIKAWMERISNRPPVFSPELMEIFTASRIGLRLLAAAAVILIVLLALRFRPLWRPAEISEETANLQANFRWPWQRRSGKLRLAAFPGAGRWLAAAHIRRIYADLMELFKKMHHERPDGVTPHEFLPQMHLVLPDNGAELETITAAYERVRYGQFPETLEEVQAVQRAWEAVRAAGKRYIAVQRANARKKDTGG